MLHTIAVHGYRSLRDVALQLGRLTVITGANGTGKSSLYSALQLLGETASGSIVGSLAHSGGLESVLWAGPEQVSRAMQLGEARVQGTARRRRPVSLMLGFTSDDLGYLVDVGLPTRQRIATMFEHDPLIKRELVWSGPVMRPASMLVKRANHSVSVHERGWTTVTDGLNDRDSILGELSDPERMPELLSLRRRVRGWRFHDAFRTDPEAPARQPQVATWTPVMAADGSDFVPAVQTVIESSFAPVFADAVSAAFPGGQVHVVPDGRRAELRFQQEGLLRPLSAAELSDGTLRYLLLATALCSPRPAGLLVLNEPETSLHPDVLPGLADLIVATSRRTQVVVVSHSVEIVTRLRRAFAMDADPADPALADASPARDNVADARPRHSPSTSGRTATARSAMQDSLLDAGGTDATDQGRRAGMTSDISSQTTRRPRSGDGPAGTGTGTGTGMSRNRESTDEWDDEQRVVPGEGFVHHHLVKRLGETLVEGQGLLTRPTWDWGTR